MTNTEFCNKITRMLGGSLALVEIERDYFGVQTSNMWLKQGQSVYLSDDFKQFLKTLAWRRFKKQVQWDNLDLRFWFKDSIND